MPKSWDFSNNINDDMMFECFSSKMFFSQVFIYIKLLVELAWNSYGKLTIYLNMDSFSGLESIFEVDITSLLTSAPILMYRLLFYWLHPACFYNHSGPLEYIYRAEVDLHIICWNSNHTRYNNVHLQRQINRWIYLIVQCSLYSNIMER